MFSSTGKNCLHIFRARRGQQAVRPVLGLMAFLFAHALSGSASAEINYDYAIGGGTTHRAYKDRIASSPIPPTANSLPSTEFTLTNYGRLVASDDNRYATGDIGNGSRAATRFVLGVSEAPESISSFTIRWEGRAQNGGIVHVYLWNVNLSTYELIGATTSTVDVNILHTVQANPHHYLDGQGKMTILAVNTVSDRGLTTDYIRLSISQCVINADCDDGNACTDDACNSGVCAHTNRTGSCSDGNPCTMNDHCSAGVCVSGNQPDCSLACDDCNVATCDPLGAPGNCDRHTPRPNGFPCDDDLFCTVADGCDAGICRGVARNCDSATNQCNTGVCNETTNTCDANPVADGTSCDDGAPCTENDTCSDGECDGTLRNCSALSDACNVGVCDPLTGACTKEPVANGTSCDDGKYCTVNDACTAGVCGGAPRSCDGSADQCNNGVCNEEQDVCVAQPLPNGTACNDGAFCTVSDSCTLGICGGTPKDCSAAGNACNTGVCSEAADACVPSPVANGTSCTDDLYCTTNESCQGGVCLGTARDCSTSANQCNTGACNEESNQCEARPIPDGATCDDGLYCTVQDSCALGQCRGTQRDCSSVSDSCNTGTCDEDSNACEPRPVENGTSCDDGQYCTVNDACVAGTCMGTSRDCSSVADHCNLASCDEINNQCKPVPLPNGTGCNDGKYCTIGDSCTSGTCGGASRDCGFMADQCHAGTCNEESDACTATPLPNGTSCNDQRFCTVQDACVNGSCEGATRDCSAEADQCNLGLCNETIDSCVAQPLPDQLECDDSNACTLGDSCVAGHCTPGQDVDCSPHDGACTIASCNPGGSTGNCEVISPVQNGTTCDDGAFCTTADACVQGQCVGGSTPCDKGLQCDENSNECVECLVPSHCDDGIDCTEDLCQASECVHRTNDEHCPDNDLFCDGAEYCDIELGCTSTGDPCPTGKLCDESTNSCGECLVNSNCNDSVACTVDTCVSGGCVYTPSDDRCGDDGLYCNGSEYCDAIEGCLSTGDPCEKGTYCNEKTDSCDECNANSQCDDGDPCTVGHTCVAGNCRAGGPVDCSNAGGDCFTATCDPNGPSGNCDVHAPVQNGTPCQDGAYCTINDACLSGQCVGSLRNCARDSDQCNIGICDEAIDSCRPAPIADGIACDDDLFCTLTDICVAGQCTGTPRDCSFADDECNRGTCNEEFHACVALPFDEGGSCDDGLFCTRNDVCSKGICRGEPNSCGELTDQCNTAVCNETQNQCIAIPFQNGTACSDGDPCAVGESCQAGQCTGGQQRNCAAFNESCAVASCDPQGPEGNCEVRTPVTDGTTCDDGAHCTTADSCQSGQCVGSALDCTSFSDQCHVATCNEETNECVVRTVDDGTPCNDGAFCTTNDVCTLGVCGGESLDCEETGGSCTVSRCNEDTNECEVVPLEDGSACDDGHPCTLNDVCDDGHCSGTTRYCGELDDACNAGVCNEDSGECEAHPVEDGTACDDESSCTHDDACREGTCTGTPLDCSQLDDDCNRGVCSEESGACEVRPVDDGIPCEDGLFCTVSETCKSGVCASGGDYDCSQLTDQCNTGVCNEESNSCELSVADDGTECDDGLYCTIDDACAQGVCRGASRDCGISDDVCTVMECVEASHSCEEQPDEDGSPCDDDFDCTDHDSCRGGVCKGSRTLGLGQWAEFYECLAGTDHGIETDCECMDLDGDGHVDLNDIAEFMREFTGP